MLGLGLGVNKSVVLISAGLDSILGGANVINSWSSENITIDGTTTTFHDYKGEHDLANLSAAGQPTYNSVGTVGSEAKPSFTFNGTTDFVAKLTPNWRAADNSGVFISVYKATGTKYGLLSTADNAGNSFWFSLYQNASSKEGLVKTGAAIALGLTGDATAKVTAVSGDGVDLKAWLNGVEDTDTVSAYTWLDSQPTQRDDISIGAARRLSTLFGGFEWVSSVYLSYTNDGDITNFMNELEGYYGI